MATYTAPFTHAQLERALDEIGIDYEIVTSYSGRGMYGASCFGVVTSAPVAVGVALAVAAEDDVSGADLGWIVDSARTDSMGRDLIVYFPNWQLDQDELEVAENAASTLNNEALVSAAREAQELNS